MFSNDDENSASTIGETNIKSECSSSSSDTAEGIFETTNIKKEIDADSELRDGLELKNLMEICKTEYIYNENVKTEKASAITTDLRKIQNSEAAKTSKADKNKCPVCHKIFDLHQDFIRHSRKFYHKPTDVTCEICSIPFGKISSLKRHIRRHKASQLRQSLMEHEKTHAERSNDAKISKEVGQNEQVIESVSEASRKQLTSINSLNDADESMRETDNIPSSSETRTKNDEGIKRHNFPEKERPYECLWCDKAYVFPQSLHKHEKIHRGCNNYEDLSNEGKRNKQRMSNITCKICSKSYSKYSNLKWHMKTIHGDETPPKIKHTFITSINMINGADGQHKEETDVDPNSPKTRMENDDDFLEKDIVCKICSKSFTRLYNLKCHMLSHSGQRPFACSLCDKTYVFPQSLNKHEKTHPEFNDGEDLSKEAKRNKRLEKMISDLENKWKDQRSSKDNNKTLNIKTELHSDNESQDDFPVESVIETFKTEFISDESIINAAERIDDNFFEIDS